MLLDCHPSFTLRQQIDSRRTWWALAACTTHERPGGATCRPAGEWGLGSRSGAGGRSPSGWPHRALTGDGDLAEPANISGVVLACPDPSTRSGCAPPNSPTTTRRSRAAFLERLAGWAHGETRLAPCG